MQQVLLRTKSNFKMWKLPNECSKCMGESLKVCQTSLDDVQRFLAGYNVVFHQGFFPDSKAGLYPEIKYSFVHLDADTYQSTKAGLEYFVPKMVAGGCVVLDDYDWGQCPGVKKAIVEMGIAVTAQGNQAWFYC